MRGKQSVSGLTRRLGALMLLLGLLLRFAVPAGYMLAPDGALAVVPCPAAGAMPAAAPMPMDHGAMMGMSHGGEAPAHHDTHVSDSCPFAALSAPATLPDAVPVLAAAKPLAATPARVSGERPRVTRLAAPPPPSRGPPPLS